VTDAFAPPPPTRENSEAIRQAWDGGGLRCTLHEGTRWYRVVTAEDAEAAESRALETFPSPRRARFTPVLSSGQIVPSAYAGDSERVALWEAVLRDIRHKGIKRVPVHETRHRHLIEVRLLQQRQLVDLTRPAISQLALPDQRPPDLSSAWHQAYPVTREWAQCIYESIPGCQGLLYESHQVAGLCTVLFSGTASVVFELVENHGLVARGRIRRMLIEEAARAGAGIDFGDGPDEDEDEKE